MAAAATAAAPLLRLRLRLLPVLVVVSLLVGASRAANVTYDHRAVVIDGVRRVLVSGSIHYPRSTPDMWPGLIQKSKDGGLDVIETYVFWDIHEPVRGQARTTLSQLLLSTTARSVVLHLIYDFEGRKDLVRFVKAVADAGLYVHLRIGPYVCAEWNYGGFPVWLHFVPGIKFRTDNEAFKAEMQRFTEKVVDTMKGAGLYASQGGPIILSQIENEYGNIDSAYGAAGKAYMRWAAGMAVSLDTGVPWVMCQQSDAPDPLINTCNGFYCDQFTPNSKSKPKMWTENWSGWFLSFGGAVPYRPAEDLAFAVARFYQRGGTFQNYYMYHGGTNFGRSTGGPFIATSYDYDAPIDEYGMVRQPKWGHLRDVHKAIKLCEPALIAAEPSYSSLGQNTEATVYQTADNSICAAFLANVDAQSDKTVKFNGNTYKLPAWSVSILPDCKNVVLNTAQINSQVTTSEMRSLGSSAQDTDDSSITPELATAGWSYAIEPVGITKENALTKPGLMEQINTTADASDFLWYSTSIVVKGDEPYLNGSQSNLLVNSLGHVLQEVLRAVLAARSSHCRHQLHLYHVPRSFLQPGSNDLVLFEQFGGDPSMISFTTRQTSSICAHVSEMHPAQIDSWISPQQTSQTPGPALRLECPREGQVISNIKFASFGTPSGTCGNYNHGECSSSQALAVVQEACVGMTNCSVPVSSNNFGDPCSGVTKSLVVEAACS
uniref:Beta-galactosidase n=1 Tax=Oryza meridionalis TaxID=40149 RepID=A0A0E0CY79_9ORYZ